MVKYITYTSASEWLDKIQKKRGTANTQMLEKSIQFYQADHDSLLKKGIGISDILFKMRLDNDSLAVAILYPLIQLKPLILEQISADLGEGIRKLLEDALQMQSLGKLKHIKGSHQIENLRKLLLAIVSDVRAVLIVLAERIWELRVAKNKEISEQQSLAEETMFVFAPLANRLGVWQLKWELEDLCLRYLKPDTYKAIAKWLSSKRQERETYIEKMINILGNKLAILHLKNFKITGRVKHIFSIYKKMERKNATIDEIYDITALRVLVPSIEDCYNVLSLIQSEWDQVPKEFDDYISQPKSNGYRSIHLVIYGPENRFIEIQIRTHQMHYESELGAAAHWRYKENVVVVSSYESKIALLREVIEWQKEMIEDNAEEKKIDQAINHLLSDRVYVFTPLGDIIDLPKGATPLDFAYHIHSEIGHRCRGAKINGKIVPLTYALQTGEKIEIITAKEASPSRDWINPQLGYIKTNKARSKAQHWFRVKDSLIEKQTKESVKSNAILPPLVIKKTKTAKPSDLAVLGVNHLLTNIAGCCKPLPGDLVIGYITQNRGISIHRKDCKNILNVKIQARLIEVHWQSQLSGKYPVDLQLLANDRTGIIRDVSTLLSGEKLSLLGLQTTTINKNNEVYIFITIEISSVTELDHAIQLLKKIPSILEVKRRI